MKEPLRLVGKRYSFSDIRGILSTHLGFNQVKSWQEMDNLATILNAAFGGESSKNKEKTSNKPMTYEELNAAFGKLSKELNNG